MTIRPAYTGRIFLLSNMCLILLIVCLYFVDLRFEVGMLTCDLLVCTLLIALCRLVICRLVFCLLVIC